MLYEEPCRFRVAEGNPADVAVKADADGGSSHLQGTKDLGHVCPGIPIEDALSLPDHAMGTQPAPLRDNPSAQDAEPRSHGANSQSETEHHENGGETAVARLKASPE